jgi:BirA family transcriptional regulator, biotin operon repressor / biotin---[acetyl-CoA-carboxylase] ligase
MKAWQSMFPNSKLAEIEFKNKLISNFALPFSLGEFSRLKSLIIYPFETISSTMDLFTLISNWKNNQDLAKENSVFIGLDPCKMFSKDCLTMVLARKQLSGRGQKARVWESPKDQGLYLSFILHLENQSLNVSGFSLAIGLAVLRTAKSFGLVTMLKWPNDVLVSSENGKSFTKLAGVLVESVTSGDNQSICIGIGMNLFYNSELENVSGSSLFPNEYSEDQYFQVLTKLTIEVYRICESFLERGFLGSRDEWISNSMLMDKDIIVKQADREFNCRVSGVNEVGALVVQFPNGQVEEIYNGEVIY